MRDSISCGADATGGGGGSGGGIQGLLETTADTMIENGKDPFERGDRNPGRNEAAIVLPVVTRDTRPAGKRVPYKPKELRGVPPAAPDAVRSRLRAALGTPPKLN